MPSFLRVRILLSLRRYWYCTGSNHYISQSTVQFSTQPKMSNPNEVTPATLHEMIIEYVMGPATSGIRATMRKNAKERGNSPLTGIRGKVRLPGRPPLPPGTLVIGR